MLIPLSECFFFACTIRMRIWRALFHDKDANTLKTGTNFGFFLRLFKFIFNFFYVDCPICLDTMTNPRALKCKHVFCSKCLKKALDVSNKCPVCQEPQGVLQGNQPPGEMTSRCDRYRSLPGYGGNCLHFFSVT